MARVKASEKSIIALDELTTFTYKWFSPMLRRSLFYSLKYSIRSFFRDVIRGVWARVIFYPVIQKNEFSAPEIGKYLRKNSPDLVDLNDDIASVSIVNVSSDLIGKDDVRNEHTKFIKPRRFGSLIRNKISTSGSTGRPLTFVQNIGAVIREEAFVYRQLRWAGFEWGQRRVWLRGDVVCSKSGANGIYWCRDYWANTLMLSSYHISTDTALAYISEIKKFDPVLIQAYPSSVGALAVWMRLNGVKYRSQKLKGIVTSSETLEPELRKEIEEAFGVKVFDWYGQAERVAAIGTCEYGSYHALTDYGRVELLPEKDGSYEVVGSGYNNKAMPLRRYRTGDRVRFSGKNCECGRVFPVIDQVIGRSDKTVVLEDGRHIARLDHVLKGFDNILEGQIAYLGDNRFEVRVVAPSGWSDHDSDRLVKQFIRRVEGVNISVKLVGFVPRGSNGKYEFLKDESKVAPKV